MSHCCDIIPLDEPPHVRHDIALLERVCGGNNAPQQQSEVAKASSVGGEISISF